MFKDVFQPKKINQDISLIPFCRPMKPSWSFWALRVLWFFVGLEKIVSMTADGRYPVNSPVEVGSLSYYLQGFIHPRWLAGFLNHQQ